MTATAMTAATAIRPYPLGDAAIAAYRRDGYVATPGILSAEEVASLRERFLAASRSGANHAQSYGGKQVFDQFVNLWQSADASLLDLALHPRMRQVATDLAGVPLRLWHDHLLVKRGHNGAPTEFHQDQPYWPHLDGDQALSAWVALVDVPPQRGCMSYITGSHRQTGLEAQNLRDSRSLFEKCPELEYQPFTTIPVKAGDVIWHHARTAHRANANDTDEDRVVVSVIYMPRATRFSGKPHVCTRDRGYEVGQTLAGEAFPEV